MKTKKIPVELVIKIKSNQLLEGRVMRNNNTSGKINAPKDWIGKEVYVLLKTNGDNNE